IGETYFFRQAEHFQALREIVLPDLIARNAGVRRLRIWSAGCANGAEPYSLAMLLREPGFERISGWNVSILGTDISEKHLAQAREARYDDWAFREASAEEATARCFVREGKRWALRPEYTAGVSFRIHNLVGDSLPGNIAEFDLILCRNVMIYFSPAVIRGAAERFYNRLAEGGWLLVGHAEPNAEVFQRFQTVMAAGATLYRKAGEELTPQPANPEGMVGQVANIANLPWVADSPEAVSKPTAERRLITDVIPPRDSPAPTVSEARALADRGEWEAAAACCRRVLAADGLDATAHFTLALILEHTGARAPAEQALRRAIYLDRAFAPAHYHLGLLLQTHDASQAIRAFRNVLALTGGRPAGAVLEHSDGMTAGELRNLAGLHLEMLGV
ncbi:MAG: protein-glutamate O-methyltransferase CheR, partial [Acidobacteriia bacterium]|nr:protein-glutamate O-methyltransferase CheR [Terriglobia bacterium]